MFKVENDWLVFDRKYGGIWASLCWEDVIDEMFDAFINYFSKKITVSGVSFHSEPGDDFFVLCHGHDDHWVGIISNNGQEEHICLSNNYKDTIKIANEFIKDVEKNEILKTKTKSLDSKIAKLKKILEIYN